MFFLCGDPDHNLFRNMGKNIKNTFHRYFNAHSYSIDPRRITILCNGMPLLRHDMPQFFSKAQAAVGLAVALAAGIMAVTSMQHLISALIKMIKPAP